MPIVWRFQVTGDKIRRRPQTKTTAITQGQVQNSAESAACSAERY
jgi:hypothetical protein